ncbi:Adenylate cyclase [Diplonema papillatum]|nr:Adenylate cyclase [Diplonema papillatum]
MVAADKEMSKTSIDISEPVHAWDNEEEEEDVAPEPSAAASWLQAFFKFLLSPVLSDNDTPVVRVRKYVMVPILLANALVGLFFFAKHLESGQLPLLIFNLIRMVATTFVLGHTVVTKDIPDLVAEGSAVVVGIVFFIGSDFLSFGEYGTWAFLFLVMDATHLTFCRPAVTWGLCTVGVLYLIVKTIEEGPGLGIYDAVPASWVEGAPPAQKGTTWMAYRFMTVPLVFLVDSFLTKMFVDGMRQEQAKATRHALMAKNIAAALAKFDLDKAERLVATSTIQHDDDMRAAFVSLLASLRVYRPYLPDALFTAHHSPSVSSIPASPALRPQSSIKPRQVPAGLGRGKVSIVFTDIQSSTDIWEKHTAAMRASMDVHNACMRKCIAETNGYEVKTIGDAFMVAFDETVDAFTFAVMAETKLLEAPWPAELLEHALCRPVRDAIGNVIWKGLRVRIGVHTGTARLEMNPTTGRTDYMGPTVNRAARAEAAGMGGGITFAKEILAELDASEFERIGAPVVKLLGSIELKGVGPVPLAMIIPRGLEAREEEIDRQLKRKRALAVHPADAAAAPVLESPAAGRILKNRVTCSRATVGNVRTNCNTAFAEYQAEEVVAKGISAVISASEKTEGLICSVAGNAIVVSWNAGKSCALHTTQSARFALLLSRAVQEQAPGAVTVGLCTTNVLHGMVGSARQRFATILGTSGDVARALSESARALGTFCLLAGSNDTCFATEPTVQVHTRPVDMWALQDELLTIFELNLSTYGAVEGVWALYEGIVAPAWSSLYKAAFHAGDVEALQGFADDPVVEKVVSIFQDRYALVKPFISTPADWGNPLNPERIASLVLSVQSDPQDLR